MCGIRQAVDIAVIPAYCICAATPRIPNNIQQIFNMEQSQFISNIESWFGSLPNELLDLVKKVFEKQAIIASQSDLQLPHNEHRETLANKTYFVMEYAEARYIHSFLQELLEVWTPLSLILIHDGFWYIHTFLTKSSRRRKERPNAILAYLKLLFMSMTALHNFNRHVPKQTRNLSAAKTCTRILKKTITARMFGSRSDMSFPPALQAQLQRNDINNNSNTRNLHSYFARTQDRRF